MFICNYSKSYHLFLQHKSFLGDIVLNENTLDLSLWLYDTEKPALTQALFPVPNQPLEHAKEGL